MNTQELAMIGELTTEQFRQKLAGLSDPQATVADDRRGEIKELCIRFAAELPALFGEDLDRKTMWDRIGSGLQSAFAKTSGGDQEFFIQQVLTHVLASPSAAAANPVIGEILIALGGWSLEDRQAWLGYFNTHLIPLLVHARARWTARKGGAA